METGKTSSLPENAYTPLEPGIVYLPIVPAAAKVEPTQQTVDALMKLDLSPGVDVEIKL